VASRHSVVAACASESEIILRRPEGWSEGELPVPPDLDLPHQISQAVPVTGVLVSAPLQTAKAVPQNMGLTRLDRQKNAETHKTATLYHM